MDKDTFLKLLVAQMKYQDPSAPTDSSAFVTQTATYSQVEALQKLTDQNASMLAMQRASSAGALVGKTATYVGEDGVAATGAVASVILATDSTEATAVIGGAVHPGRPHHRVHRLTSRPALPDPGAPVLRSMFSAISGLRAHQTKMDTVANNIANVNTVGFKTQNTVFETTLTQVLRSGRGPDATEGGTNPAQVGLGVKLAAITTDFGQGKTQNTGRALDFMIQGDGFFVTENRRAAALHPRRLVHLRRAGQADHLRRQPGAGLDGRRRREDRHRRHPGGPAGAVRRRAAAARPRRSP